MTTETINFRYNLPPLEGVVLAKNTDKGGLAAEWTYQLPRWL